MTFKTMLVMCSLASAVDSRYTEFWLYVADFISAAIGILLFFAYCCTEDKTLLFAATTLFGSAILSVVLSAWWPLTPGWLIVCILLMLVSGANRPDRKGQGHDEDR
jgi:hypothetical protein